MAGSNKVMLSLIGVNKLTACLKPTNFNFCGDIFKRFRQVSFIYSRIERRAFALKIYSQGGLDNSLSNKLLQYIKIKNDLMPSQDLLTVADVINNDNTIRQLQSIIYHSSQTSPEDVIKLFVLYTSINRSVLCHRFSGREVSTVFKYKIESSISRMTYIQLYKFAEALKNLKQLRITFFKHLRQLIFEESLIRAESVISLSEALKYFIIALELYSNGVVMKTGYMEFIVVFEKLSKDANPVQLSQVLYFIGLAKKKSAHLQFPVEVTKSLVPNFNNISFVDAGLAISGLFKLGLRLNEENLLLEIGNKIMQRTKTDELFLDHLESYAFVSMVKYLRLCMYKNSELLNHLKEFLQKLNKDSLSPPLVCHFIALYANSDHYDFEVYSLLTQKFNEYLTSSVDVIRIKDISRMMWALSHAQHQCSESFLTLVVKTLEEFSQTGDFLIHVTHVVDSTLGLCTLRHFPEKLLISVLQPAVFQTIRQKKQSRYLSRFLVLSEVQKAFMPDLLPALPNVNSEELPQRSISEECLYRACLGRIRLALRWLRRECGIPVFELKFLVPHIHYCSIVPADKTIEDASLTCSEAGNRVLSSLKRIHGQKIAVDINDGRTTLTGGAKVIGMETLKRDILQARGWTVRVLDAKEVNACGEDAEALAALIVQRVVEDKADNE